MVWRACIIACYILILAVPSVGAVDEGGPKVKSGIDPDNPFYYPKESIPPKEEKTPAEEVFHFERMHFLHPVQKQVICRLAGDENMRFAHSVLVKSIVEQFKAAPQLNVVDKDVAEAIGLLENFWRLIQRVPGTQLRHDPLYELKDDPNARFGLRLWAKHVCSPENIMCDEGFRARK